MTPRTPRELACRELVQLVTDYLEGVLPPEEHARFEQHLESCKGCTAYLRQMRDLVRLSGRIRDDVIPPEAPRELLQLFETWKAQRS